MSDLNQLEALLQERTLEVEQALVLLRDQAARSAAKCQELAQVMLELQQWKGCHSAAHQQFLASYVPRLAARLHAPAAQMRELELAVQVYQVGLLGLPDALVAKPLFALTADERAQYERYPELSARALRRAPSLQKVAELVRDHREWVNGRGPQGLGDEAIGLGSKILGTANDYFELWSGRLVQNCSGKVAAADYMLDWVGRRYDARVVQVLLEEVEDFNAACLRAAKRVLAELEPGMVLADDLAGDAGGALLVAGTVLTESHIRTLHRHASHLHHPLVVSVQLPCD